MRFFVLACGVKWTPCLRFQAALVQYGVSKGDIFQTNDLSEKKDIANVTNTMFALGRAVS